MQSHIPLNEFSSSPTSANDIWGFVDLNNQREYAIMGLSLDISELRNPQISGVYTGQTAAIDHNGFTLGNYYYMFNYQRGLSVIDVSDPTNMKDVALFDTYSVPETNTANFNGAWGVYPFLPSGNILVSDIEYGLFVLKLNENDGAFPANTSNDDDEFGNSGGGSFGFFCVLML